MTSEDVLGDLQGCSAVVSLFVTRRCLYWGGSCWKAVRLTLESGGNPRGSGISMSWAPTEGLHASVSEFCLEGFQPKLNDTSCRPQNKQRSKLHWEVLLEAFGFRVVKSLPCQNIVVLTLTFHSPAQSVCECVKLAKF